MSSSVKMTGAASITARASSKAAVSEHALTATLLTALTCCSQLVRPNTRVAQQRTAKRCIRCPLSGQRALEGSGEGDVEAQQHPSPDHRNARLGPEQQFGRELAPDD